MNQFKYNRTAFICAGFAFIAAIFLFPALYHFAPLGINIPLTVSAFYCATMLAMHGKYSLKTHHNWGFLPLIALFSLQFMFFNNGFLNFLCIIMLAALISIHVLLMTNILDTSVFSTRIFASIGYSLAVRPFHKISAFYANIFAHKNKTVKKAFGGVLLGIAICLPVLALMLLLLTSADIVFEKMISSIFSWAAFWKMIFFIILLAAIFTCIGSFLVSLNEKKHYEASSKNTNAKFNLMTVFVILIPLALLMLVFSGVQLVYMTGLSDLPYDFDYSSYARQGFFQLCAAAALIFIAIIICYRFTRHAEGGKKTALRILFTILAVSILILLVSSFWRMSLYEQIYRFTRLRLYTQAFMILLGIVTIITIIKIWQPRLHALRYVFLSIAVCLAALCFFNADAFIAKDAVKYAEANDTEPDIDYLITLSADALPYYYDYINTDNFALRDPDFGEYLNKYNLTDAELAEYEKASELYYDSLTTARRIVHFAELIEKDDFRTFNTARVNMKQIIPSADLESARAMIEWDSNKYDSLDE